MEKAILRTLTYADIFDYPLNIWEIHKWLIGRKLNLRQVEKGLEKLSSNNQCQYKGEYYFLPGRANLVSKRKRREHQSKIYWKKAQLFCQVFRIIPWVKLVGISGGLAMNNANQSADIDLFIITSKNRLWICRLLILVFLGMLSQRRKKDSQSRAIAGKFCVNILLEEDRLQQLNQDLFIAHELLQMKVLWEKEGIYAKYLADNEWVFKLLPNWVGNIVVKRNNKRLTSSLKWDLLIDKLENLARRLQLWYMKSPQGMERIAPGAVYFHPKDYRLKVLSEFKKRTILRGK